MEDHRGQIEVHFLVDKFLSGLYGTWPSKKLPLKKGKILSESFWSQLKK